MDAFANDTPEHRDEAFRQAAAELGFAKAIVEKDFWVCWSLQHLFTLPDTIATTNGRMRDLT